MPVEYIYEPWKAPIEEQRKANCIIGKDYPARIVIHEEVSRDNAKKMQKIKNDLLWEREFFNSKGQKVGVLISVVMHSVFYVLK